MPDQATTPLVSIVMPTFNGAEFIKEAIESIQKQTNPSWELIIIDDGSSDNTSEIIHQINDSRILYYQLSHVGMEHARNTGLQKAKGEFIGFIDSDDLWGPTKLEKQLRHFAENTKSGFCLTGGFEFSTRGEPLVFYYKQHTGTSESQLFVPFFQSRVVAATSSLLFKRECLDTVRFIEQLELAHIHFILNLAAVFPGVILYESLSYRRLHQSNYSTLNYNKRHSDGINLIKHYRKVLPGKIFADALLKSHIHYGEHCLIRKEKLIAIKEFLRAWRYQPFNIVPVKKMAKAILS